MAGSKIKGINIKIGADTRGLDTALKSIENKSKSTKNELKEINTSIKKAPDSLVVWKQKQETLTKAIADSKEKVKLLENAQEEVTKQLQSGKINGEQYRAFQRELENARAESRRLESNLSETNSKISELGRSAEDSARDTDQLGDSLQNAGNKAENSSDGYTVLKNILANLAVQGINFAFDKLKIFTQQIIETGKAFEASMSNVGAISGATGEELEKLSAKAKQMGATTKYTASQAADAFGYMALAGWKTEDMLSGIDGVLSLAAASNMDLALASDIVTDYLTAFGLTAQDSAKFADQMSYAMSHSNTTTELLGEAYKNCAATAASLGYSVEETTAVIMTMANAGVKGGEAGTALNAIMTRLATDTKGCATQLEKFGVHVYNEKGEMQELSSILEGVSGVWNTLTDQQQANLAKIIAGTNHYSALQTIMNGLSASAKESGMSFTDYAAALEECNGTALDMSETMIDNLAGDMTILDSAVDGVKIALSEKLNPILRELVQYITEKMPDIQESSEKAFDVFVDVVEWGRKNIPKIQETLKDLLPLISGVAGGIGSMTVAKTTATAVQGLINVVKSLNMALFANPATAVAAAIGVLGTAITVYCVQAETELTGLQKISEAIDEQHSKEHEKIEATRESIQKVNEKFRESARAVDEETRRVEYLWKELDNLEHSSGEVYNKDKIRAEYILNELNETLGTEYQLTGNQIEGYKDLQKEIDNTIAKKKAEAYFDAYLADSAEMAENKASAKSSYIQASKERSENKENMENTEKAFKSINSTDMTAEEIVDYYDKHGDISLFDSEESLERAYAEYYVNGSKWAWNSSSKRFTKEQLDAAKAYITAKQEYVDATSRATEAEAEYNDIMQYFDKLDRAKAALDATYEGHFDDVEKILYNPQEHYQDILENAKDFDEDVKKAYNEAQTDLSYELKLAVSTEIVNQDEVNEILRNISELAIKGAKTGAKPEEIISDTTNLREYIQQLIDAEADISVLSGQLKNSGIDITEFLGEDYSGIFSKQINEGYNIDDFLEWTVASDKKIARESWDEFKTYVEKEIEEKENYDITPILKTAKNAGIDVGEAFGGNYMGIVQNQINEGFDPTELIKWFYDTDEKAAEYFKNNYIDVSQKLIDSGYDPTQMILHFAETDKEIAKGFEKNFADFVQTMLDNGFNPTRLMQWFFDNGVDGTKIFTDEMKKEFEKTDFSDVKLEGLFNHLDELIASNAAKEADVYGKNFTDYVNQYLYQQGVKNGEYKPNSYWDYQLLNDKVKWDEIKTTRFATGGYISAGNSGIVAESGPELLEIINGGIRITPLSENAGNTAVSGNKAGQKIFYNTYNINNPRISNDMDIRQIAQKLAVEQRRNEMGRGL